MGDIMRFMNSAWAVTCAAFVTLFSTGCLPNELPNGTEGHGYARHELQLNMSETRVVLTPGGGSIVRIGIERAEPHRAVQLKMTGIRGALTATLSDDSRTVSTEDRDSEASLNLETTGTAVVLTLSADMGTRAQELTLRLRAKAGHIEREEKLKVSIQRPSAVADAEAYAPGVTGERKTLTVDGHSLTVEVINGLAIWQGDIVLGNVEDLEQRAPRGQPVLNGKSSTCSGSGLQGCARYSDATVGFRFRDDWDDSTTAADENQMMRTRVRAAIDSWENLTGIRFVERSSGELVEFRNGMGCSSALGRVFITGFDVQSITLSTQCGEGQARHEIGHALGLGHEQGRADRDAFVVIYPNNIQPARLVQFAQNPVLFDRGPYNLRSVMHYGRGFFSVAGTACDAPLGDFSGCTILSLAEDACLRGVGTCALALPAMGQRGVIAESDALGVYWLYPPIYEIVGASEDASVDRVTLRTQFSTPLPRVPQPQRIVWSSDRDGELGTGPLLELRADTMTRGTHAISASYMLAGVSVASRTVTLNLDNAPPAVSLSTASGRTDQPASRAFAVIASVSDAEDGDCAASLCRYEWTPAPSTGPSNDRVANYQFDDTGPQTITVRVTDGSGAVGTAALDLNIVPVSDCTSGACPPTALISTPTPWDFVPPDALVYYLDQTVRIGLTLGDVDAPPNSDISYRLSVTGSGVAESTILEGRVMIFDSSRFSTPTVSWVPEANVPSWMNCASSRAYRDFELVLEARDGDDRITIAREPITLGCSFI